MLTTSEKRELLNLLEEHDKRKGGGTMDYKGVVQEQIRELQKVQDNLISVVNIMNANECCNVASTITELCRKLSNREIE